MDLTFHSHRANKLLVIGGFGPRNFLKGFLETRKTKERPLEIQQTIQFAANSTNQIQDSTRVENTLTRKF